MKKIAFISTTPPKSFLYDHMTELVKEYEVHLLSNFGNNNELKDIFSSINVVCHDIPINRKISIFYDLKTLNLIDFLIIFCYY